MAKVRAFRTLENAIRRMGFVYVAGVDEVGRGCLAGPVVAAAVVLNPDRYVPRIGDSKTVTALERDAALRPDHPDGGRLGRRLRLLRRDRHHQHPSGVAAGDAAGRPDPGADARTSCWWTPSASPSVMAQRAVIHGDSRCTAIAAASIVAKVTRDRMMLELHADDPRYGFDRHKGYATRDHLQAVAQFGYSAVHRQSFRPPSLFDKIG